MRHAPVEEDIVWLEDDHKKYPWLREAVFYSPHHTRRPGRGWGIVVAYSTAPKHPGGGYYRRVWYLRPSDYPISGKGPYDADTWRPCEAVDPADIHPQKEYE
jgi:hypothetical protein